MQVKIDHNSTSIVSACHRITLPRTYSYIFTDHNESKKLLNIFVILLSNSAWFNLFQKVFTFSGPYLCRSSGVNRKRVPAIF